MIWNTIAHPRMMITDGGNSSPTPSGPTPVVDGSGNVDLSTVDVIQGIKYADPHKMAFFDLLVDATNAANPKLIHGDFEIVKKKILNHELVVGGIVFYDGSADTDGVIIGIDMAMGVAYNYTMDAIMLTPTIASAIFMLLPDNTIQDGGNKPSGSDDGGSTAVVNPGGIK